VTSEIPGNLVVRTYAPARRWIMLATAVLLAGIALYLAFEFGRNSAGYDAMRAAAQRDALREQLDKQQVSERELRVQLASAEEARVAEVRERSELARTIGELQAQVARAQQDVQFYRGLVPQQQPQGGAPEVRVQQFHVIAGDGPQKFVLRFALNRPVRPEEAVNGTVAITVDGTRDGAAATADLAALGAAHELPFNFRYYANFEQAITLPADFKPERVTLEVRPARRGVPPYRQTFVWNVEG
jgi:hypothetical protein